MKSFSFFLFLLLCFNSWSQQYSLKPVAVEDVKHYMKLTNNYESIYCYLTLNYTATSEKLNTKTYDYSIDSVCAFTQKFSQNITYSLSQCDEEGGATVTLTLPKINKTSLKKWIEAIYASEGMDQTNYWNASNTTFKPAENEAGCYFEIKETKTHTTIERYCGC